MWWPLAIPGRGPEWAVFDVVPGILRIDPAERVPERKSKSVFII